MTEKQQTYAKRGGIAAGAVALLVLVFAIASWAVGGSSGADQEDLIVYAPVETRTLQEVVAVRGEISREKLGDLYASQAGVVDRIQIEEGESVDEGTTVYSLNGRPGVTVTADEPFFRPLDVGSEGYDVLQLEQILVDAGYELGEPDLLFTRESKAALQAWQRDHRYPNANPEDEETLTVQLVPNPSGYEVSALSSAGATIIPTAPEPLSESADLPTTGTASTATPLAGATPLARLASMHVRDVPRSLGPTPTLNIAAAPTEVGEGGDGNFIITSNAVAPVDLVIRLSVSGNATPGSDYLYLPGAVTLEAGDSQLSVPFSAFEDSDVELDETVTVRLLSGTGYSVGAPNKATTTITSADGPEVDVNAVPEDIGEGGSAAFRFTADQPFLENTTINFAITGSATVDDDYVELEDSVEFRAGQSTVDLPVRTLVDNELEADETINLNMTPQFGDDGSYALGGETSATVTILASTGEPILTMEPTPKIVTEGQPSQFVITASQPSNDDIEVHYLVGGNATPRSDYVELDGTVTLPAGFTEAQVTLNTEVDRDVEPDETVALSLVPAGDYVLGNPAAGVVTIESVELPELSITGGGSVTEGGAAVFTVTSDQPMPRDTSLEFTYGGTATPGVDYVPPTGTIRMPRGSTRATVSIHIVDDDSIFQPGDLVVAQWPARVGKIHVEQTQIVIDGEPVMEFVEEEFSINITVNASDRPELTTDMPVDIEVEATGQSAEGVVLRLDESATVDEGTEIYEGEVSTDGDLAAIDGAQVNVDVVIEEATDAIVVPVAAVLLDGQGNPEVRVVDPETGNVKRVSVVTGLTEGSFVEIREGLNGDEQVIVQIEGADDESDVTVESDDESPPAGGDTEPGGSSPPDSTSEGGGEDGDEGGDEGDSSDTTDGGG